jgi:hypothetical protein
MGCKAQFCDSSRICGAQEHPNLRFHAHGRAMALNTRAARAAGHFEYECAANPEKNGKENGQKKSRLNNQAAF